MMIGYVAPFVSGSVVALISWLFVTDKSVDVALFSALLFYSFPAYMLLIVPCYAFMQAVHEKFLLSKWSLLLPLVVALLQTIVAGHLLRAQRSSEVLLFFILTIAAYTFHFGQSKRV